MRYVRTTLLAAAAAFIAAGCRPATTGLSEADREAIFAAHRNFADWVKSKNSEAIGQLFMQDGVLMAPNSPEVVGPAAVKAFGDAFPPVAEFSLTEEVVDGSADVAYVRGRYSISLALPGAAPENGKYVEVWRKQADGSWKLAADIWNSSVPLVAPVDSAPKTP